jgi:hypothetical protein
LTTDYRYLVSTQEQFTLSASASRFQYLPEALKVNSYNLYQGATGWLLAVNQGRGAVGLILIGGVEKATNGRVDGDKSFYGARFTLQNAFTDRIGAFFVGGVQTAKYSQINTAFNLTRRDSLYDITAGITWTFSQGWSLRPQAVYFKNKSNIPLSEYDRTDFSVNVRRDF